MNTNKQPYVRFTMVNQWRRCHASWARSESLLHNWKRQVSVTSSDADKEVIALRKKLREAEMERDILKKAALIFGRSG